MTDRISHINKLKQELFRGHIPDLPSIGGRWLEASFVDIAAGNLKQGADLYKYMLSFGWNDSRMTSCGLSNLSGIPVVIAARNIQIENQSFVKAKQSLADRVKTESVLESVYSVYYIPAILDQTGQLNPSCCLLPWFIDHMLNEESLGVYEGYIEQRKPILGKIPDWKTWLSLAFELYQKVSGVPFNSQSAFGYKYSDSIYIIPDSNVYNLLPLNSIYNKMISSKKIGKVTERIISDQEVHDKKRFTPKGVEHAFSHSGHVYNLQPLAPSHRSVTEQIIKLDHGGILGVNTPIGTAPEICVLDSIASRMVNAAVLGEKPPLQAILLRNKNEIGFWKKHFNVQCDKTFTGQQEALALLGYSWVSGSGLMAAVLVDDHEAVNLEQDNIFTVGVGSDRGMAELDNPSKIKEITEKVIDNCSKYFKEELPTLEKCRSKIHETLVTVDFARQSLLLTGVRIQRFIQADSSGQDLLFFPEDELELIIARRGKLLERLGEWTKHFKSVPLAIRIGANSDLGKIKLKAYYEAFRNEEEKLRIPSIDTYEDVEKGLSAYDQELAGEEAVLDEIVRQQDKTELMIRKLGKIGLDIEMLKKYISQPEKINLELDSSLRLLAFWLAVHYFECRWLAGESIVLKHQRGRNDDHSASRYIDRLSLLTPCILAEAGNLVDMKGMKEGRLSDLFIPNAENIHLSEVLPLFELTQRLCVMGDPAASLKTNFVPLDQIWKKPVRKNAGSIDGILLSNSEQENGITPGFFASSGLGIGGGIMFNNEPKNAESVEEALSIYSLNLLMQATDRSEWSILNRDGMWLLDNVRSYEEIVSFASMMWFNDKLKSIMGQAQFAGKKFSWLPISLWQTDSSRAQRYGLDYTQDKEVDEVIRWIKGNYDSIRTLYPDKARDELALIVTPFAAQKDMLHKAMIKEFRHLAQVDIRVAALSEMIPGETYPLVLFSGVFSKSDGSQLYVTDKTLLYKAVLLASDAFIYFGDINALPEKDGETASRLRRKLKPLNRKK